MSSFHRRPLANRLNPAVPLDVYASLVDALYELPQSLFIGALAAALAAMLVAYGTAAALPIAGAAPAQAQARRAIVKDDSRLLNIGATVRSGKYWNFTTFMTPVEEFYVRNHYPTPTAEQRPVLTPENWRLRIHGASVERPVELTYEQLLAMPSRSIIATMECHGNGRTLFWEQDGLTGEQVSGGNWVLGAVGAPHDTPVMGTEGGREFFRVLIKAEKDDMDVDLARQDVVDAALDLVARHPEVGAIVLECTNMPPYAAAVQAATGRPVHDIYSMITWFHAGLRPRVF